MAYIIYTSGTTGKPKGVMIEHSSVFNYIECIKAILGEVRYIDYSSNVAFDLSITTTLFPISTGKCICIYNNDIKNIDNYIKHLESNNIDFLKTTPSFLQTIPLNKLSKRIKYIFIGGEKCRADQKKIFLQNVRYLYDEYGPTETTVGVTHVLCNNDNVSIGKPIDNISCYILDKALKVVPIGVVGELYIGGAGLARGYLNRPDLTAEKFIANPFASKSDISRGYSRLYKTGDLVKLQSDGNIEYIGRNDSQVKIRGYRIELGEIENTISSIEGVKQSCVVVRERNNTKHIVAYYVMDNHSDNSEDYILNKLELSLPEYMIPSLVVRLETFPLTINGKLDKQALPDPDFMAKRDYVAPKTVIEKKLCKIWQEVLNLDKVGVNDDFFKIGGDSILSIQLNIRLKKEKLYCSIKDIFEHRTINRLSSFILTSNNTISNVITEQGILEGSFNLLPVQKWFFQNKQQFTKFNHWNQSFLVRVPEISIDVIQDIVVKIVEHHDILRVIFTPDSKQRYRKKIVIPDIQYLNTGHLSDKEIQDTLTRWQSHFNIFEDPLWCASNLT